MYTVLPEGLTFFLSKSGFSYVGAAEIHLLIGKHWHLRCQKDFLPCPEKQSLYVMKEMQRTCGPAAVQHLLLYKVPESWGTSWNHS